MKKSMKTKSVIFEGGIDKVSTLVDGSLRVILGTQELPDETEASIMKLRKKPGYVFISTQPISKDQMLAIDKATENISTDSKEFGQKTPSQRLRSVMYILWEQNAPKQLNPDTGDLENVEFDLFYKRELNKIIDHYKTKLD